MLPFIVLGLFAGAIYSLASLGIVLTYKTTGIFNFAYGGVAMFCAYVFWQFRDRWGLDQWLAIPLLLVVVAPILGLILEAMFRSLAASAPEVQIVVSLGVLAFFTTLVPILFGSTDQQLNTIFPSGQFTVFSNVTITGNEAGTFLLAVAMAIGLSLLLRRTRLGTATRAVVDNRDLASLVAVSPGLVSQAAWIISTIFAAIAGILLSAQEGLVTYVLPFLVIYSFAPAVLGRLTNLPLAFAGSIALGLIDNILAKYGSNSSLVANLEASIPYLALLVLLIVYGRRLTEVRASGRPLSSARSVASPRRDGGLWAVGAVVGFAVLPNVFSDATVHSLAEAMAYAIVALTLVVLTGWTGQISLAQMSFAGIGAFTAAHIAGTDAGKYPLAVLVSILIAVPVSLLIGALVLRLTGLFLALATMAFALVMDNVFFTMRSISGGITGITLTTAKIGPISLAGVRAQYYLCAIVLAVATAGAWLLRRGPVGRRLQMIRDAPNAAATLGASVTVTKLAVFAGCAAVAAVGGTLLAITQTTVDPSQFSFNTSLELLLVVVLGGRSLVSGAIIAGAFDLVQLLPLPTAVDKYLPLGIAVSVVAIAREPDGLPQVMLAQLRACSAVLYSRASRFAQTHDVRRRPEPVSQHG
ncbi:MAG TPA: ABC transporter permease [Mycobacteriales bacterium]|nr:ABC transporter permease [Mycobacteriales bacterium]